MKLELTNDDGEWIDTARVSEGAIVRIDDDGELETFNDEHAEIKKKEREDEAERPENGTTPIWKCEQ